MGQPGRLALRATLGDLAPVAGLMGGDTVGVDSARAQLDVTGPAWHWKLQAAADAYGIAFGGNLANRVTLTGAVTLDSTRVGAVSGDLRVKDAAYGKLSLRELTVVGGYDSTLALDLNLNVSDSVRVATRIRGTVSTARDTVRAELQRLTLDEGGRQWALERPATLGFGPRVEVGGLALRAGQRRVAMNGVFDRHGSSDLTLTITALDLEALRAAGIVPIGGRVDGNLHLTGPAATPRLQGKMGLAILSSRGQQVGTVGSDLDWTERGLRIAAAVTPTRGSALTVEGTLPYRLTFTPRDTSAAVGSEPLASDAVSLAVRADSFDLSLLQPLLPPDAATGLGGRLRADARIGGTMREARATGTLELRRAALELPAIRVAYQQGELDGRLDGDALRIERLRLLTGKKEQELTATGTVRLRPLSEPALDLAATLRHFRLVNSDQLKTAASGRIQLSGTLLKPELRGKLTLDRTDFFVGAGAAQTRVEEVELTPEELRRLARDFGPSVLSHAKETPGLMDRVKLDLAIQMPQQVWIRKTGTPKADIELTGNVRLTQQPGQDMQFFGHVEPVPDRGSLELSGRQFRLSDGDINLAGPVDSTKLDVNAIYEVPTQGGGEDEGVQITVHARGRLDSLGLDFTSDPSMSRDDILSYIVTGGPASDNPLFESQGSGGGNAGEQVAIGHSVERDLECRGQGPRLRRVPDPAGPDPWAHPDSRPLRQLAAVPRSAASAPGRQPGPGCARHEPGPRIRAGVPDRTVAPLERAGRESVARHPVQGAPCVLAAGRRCCCSAPRSRRRSPRRMRSTGWARRPRCARSISSSRTSRRWTRISFGGRSRSPARAAWSGSAACWASSRSCRRWGRTPLTRRRWDAMWSASVATINTPGFLAPMWTIRPNTAPRRTSCR